MKNPQSFAIPSNKLPLALTRIQGDNIINDIASFMRKLRYLQGHSELKKDKDFTIFFRGHSDLEWEDSKVIHGI